MATARVPAAGEAATNGMDPFLTDAVMTKYLLPDSLPAQTDLWASMALPVLSPSSSAPSDEHGMDGVLGGSGVSAASALGLVDDPMPDVSCLFGAATGQTSAGTSVSGALSSSSSDSSSAAHSTLLSTLHPLTPPVSPPDGTAADVLDAPSLSNFPLQAAPPAVANQQQQQQQPFLQASLQQPLDKLVPLPQQLQTSHKQEPQRYQTQQQQPLPAAGSATGKAATKSKKVAHNVIERRYRNNINDKINELKATLPASLTTGPNVKLNKASILRKGIEYIQFLKLQNGDLARENGTLKGLLTQHNIAVPQGRQPSDPPPYSPHSPGSSVASGPPSPNSLSSAPSPSSAPTARVVMGLVLLGVFLVSTSPLASTNGTSAGAFDVTGTSSGSRVLSSLPTAAPSASWGWSLLWTCQSALGSWLTRLALAIAFFFVVYFRTPASDSESARARAAHEHDKKCEHALSTGDRLAAKQHALKAAECLGRPLPNSRTELWFQLVSQLCLQVSHRLSVGLWLDRFLTAHDAAATASVVTGAAAAHKIHQLLLLEGSGSGSATTMAGSLSPDAMGILTAASAVNLAEAAGPQLDANTLVDIYVAAAAQTELVSNGQLPFITAQYLRCAQKAFARTVRTSRYSWLFQPEGRTFFMQGAWKAQTITLPSGSKLAPGSHDQLGLAFRLHLLSLAIKEYITGGDLELVAQWLHDLRSYSDHSQDRHSEWWALMMVVAMKWRQSKNTEARQVFAEAEKLKIHKNRIQSALYAAFRAQQALLDGDQTLCWLASERASSLLKENDCEPCASLHKLYCGARLIALRQLLSVRVSLYRLRSYLHEINPESVPAIQLRESDHRVDFKQLLRAAQDDVQTLQSFADDFVLAEPAVYLYQAICRSLAGGRIQLTEHLFNKSLKTAKRLQLPFDEALSLLHSCSHLQSTLTPAVMQAQLSKAAVIFSKLQTLDELASARKLLNRIVMVR
eukprot:m.133163 g.133163  ORF g.133163 m.133163 type:complete len:966 (-) comp16875_c0_seq2:998-3895(-)